MNIRSSWNWQKCWLVLSSACSMMFWGSVHAAPPVNDADPYATYARRVANVEWTAARTLVVQNLTAGDTLAVAVEIDAKPNTSLAVVDENGRPVVAQLDDLDADGAIDEVCFLLPAKDRQVRTVTLLSAKGDLIPAPCDLRVQARSAGSWKPLRMQPSSSPGTTQHSTYISGENRRRAREIVDRLEMKVPMHLVECDDFRLFVGETSGLIEGMRPGSIPAGYMGSFLREYVPEQPQLSNMVLRCAGPVRCRFEWPDVGRRLTVYRNGVIESTWTKPPPQLQTVICAYPYQYVETGADDVVRYSQMLEMRRILPKLTSMNFFGRHEASLGIDARGMTAREHQVWLDGGEVGWELALDHAEKVSPENPHERAGRLFADTLVTGGMHVISWLGSGEPSTLLYRIATFGRSAPTAAASLRRLSYDRLPKVDAPVVDTPVEPSLRLRLKRSEITVNRLHPNHFNGWELRPVTLAKHNPQPAYFAATLTNQTTQDADVMLSLDAADWMLAVSVLSDRVELDDEANPGRLVQHYRREQPLLDGEDEVVLHVPAGRSIPIEVVVRPKPESLGRLACRLNWRGANEEGSAKLSIVVKPTLLFMPVYAPKSDLGREYATLTRGHPPLLYDPLWYGGPTPQRTEWNRATHRDYERHGFWTYDHAYVKDYLAKRGKEKAEPGTPALWKLDPTDWASEVLKVFQDPGTADYRVRIYLHDEIWEIFGGYKGRWRYLSDAIDADRMILRHAPNPAWSSFQEPAIDEPFQYHLKLPNDVPELFYYCGRDERLQQYARKLAEPARAQFARWKADPGFLVGAGTDEPRQLISFWISTQLHVTKYSSVRRQIWWLRHLGIESFNSWSFRSGGYSPYAGRILHWMGMPVHTTQRSGYLLTDRGLAWIDMKEDMELVTLVTLLREERQPDPATSAKLDDLARQAVDASQQNDFEKARHLYMQALKELSPGLTYLAARDHYAGPVEAEPLPDLFALDMGFREAQKLPRITLPRLAEAGPRPKPVMDGVLDNAYLEQGVTLQLRENMQGVKLKADTSVYVARDQENLYVFFSCDEPMMDQLRMNVEVRDAGVWKDDCVEVFFDRVGDGKTIAHILLSAAGIKFDRRGGQGTKWNPEYQTAVLREEKSWTAELLIPFAILGEPPGPGETWRMNFARERKPVRELGAWSVTFGGFSAAERFGYVQFK